MFYYVTGIIIIVDNVEVDNNIITTAAVPNFQ